MSDFLAISLGNSNAAMAVAREDAGVSDFAHVRRIPIERIEDVRPGLQVVYNRAVAGVVMPIVIASVNPTALERLGHLVAEVAHVEPLVAGADFPVPLRIELDEPERVGIDRQLDALAAYRHFKRACIVVDFGTAITVNAIRSDGAFMGGAILPGLMMMARALADGTAQLPLVTLADEPPLIGRNTEGAITAGVLRGTAGAVTELVAAAIRVVGADARVILTGGAAERMAGLLPPENRAVRQNLVLEGLVIAYREWRDR